MQTQYELTTHIAKTNPIEMGFDGKNRSSHRNLLLTFSTFMGYHGQNTKMTSWVSLNQVAEISGVKRDLVVDVIHYLRDIGVLHIKKDRYNGATFLHNHYTWLGFRQPAIMFSEWLALKKAKTPYVKPEPVITNKPVPETLQQSPRPCEAKPSDSTFEDDMLATEPMVKPESYLPKPKQSLQGVSMEGFIAGQVFLDYSDFKIMFQKVNNISDKLSIAAQNRYAGHINEFTEEIPF